MNRVNRLGSSAILTAPRDASALRIWFLCVWRPSFEYKANLYNFSFIFILFTVKTIECLVGKWSSFLLLLWMSPEKNVVWLKMCSTSNRIHFTNSSFAFWPLVTVHRLTLFCSLPLPAIVRSHCEPFERFVELGCDSDYLFFSVIRRSNFVCCGFSSVRLPAT